MFKSLYWTMNSFKIQPANQYKNHRKTSRWVGFPFVHFMGKWTILASEIEFLIQSDRQSYLFSLPSSTANTTIATASIRILVGYRQFKNCIQQCILTFTFGPLKISCVTYDLGWDSIFMTDQKPCCYTLHSPQWFEMIEKYYLAKLQ